MDTFTVHTAMQTDVWAQIDFQIAGYAETATLLGGGNKNTNGEGAGQKRKWDRLLV